MSSRLQVDDCVLGEFGEDSIKQVCAGCNSASPVLADLAVALLGLSDVAVDHAMLAHRGRRHCQRSVVQVEVVLRFVEVVINP